MTNRRDLLKQIAAAGGWLAFRGLLPAGAFAATEHSFPPGVWGGNDPRRGHPFLRDGGALPEVLPGRKVDVAIIGGGLAGLAAAYRLRDTPFLLVEQADRVGGHCVRDRWNDIWYSGAAAYFVEPEPPLDKLYAELAFPLKKVREPADSAILGYNRILDTFGKGLGKLPYPPSVRRDFARAKKDFTAVLNGDDCPVMPLGETSEASKAFDRMSFADWMLKEKKYHPAVKAYVDLYCRSAFGAPSSEFVSAFAGLNFYVSEFADRYTFPGGNALAAELLRGAIEKAGADRILVGRTAVRVEPKGDRTIVTLVDPAGEFSAIEAKVAILACPKLFAKSIVPAMPKDQLDAIAGLSYGSYVVANVLSSSPIVETSYDTWTDVAPFTDFIVADWVTRGPDLKSKSRKQVLTVYYPVAYQHAQLLEDGSYDAFRSRVVEHLEFLYMGAASKIEDVKLYRWGHALCHAGPGWYTNRAATASRPMGRILFAHSDNQGLPAFEAALVEGMSAAKEAKTLLAGG